MITLRTGDTGLRERGRRFRTVDEEDEDNCERDCGSDECEARVHIVAECSFSFYERERGVYIAQLRKIEGCETRKF